ncbi:hypothetical protein GR702_01925 [Novosphingobium sp. FGD1]|uniref:Uncharacterized protein n=1 Tax=Novosphingobium silvae TaxID=2692619 RepID=A0A7X4K6S4_9SPHN|nr:hypothetical protein [Novosphingobium silvae]MYL96533.1 hypothetical protein [Novosphingobium silvae]
MAHTVTTSLAIGELREFASFAPCEQRYIRRSLDIGLRRHDATILWARDEDERESIRDQYEAYRELKALRRMEIADDALDIEALMGKLVRVAAYDLGQGRLLGFSAFRFLYERLLGAWVRPWLPGAFCGAAALPHLHPDQRRKLLHSISEAVATAPGWSEREPAFYPEFIDDTAA